MILDEQPAMPETQMETRDLAVKKEYRPSDQEILREHEVRIRFLSRGLVVSVGCKDIAFTDKAEALNELNEYFTKPYETSEKWRKILSA